MMAWRIWATRSTSHATLCKVKIRARAGLVHRQQVTKIGARVSIGARRSEVGIERTVVACEASIPQVDATSARQHGAVTGQASRQHAVEHIDAEVHRLHQTDGVTEAHEVPRTVSGKLVGRCRESRDHLLAGLAHRQPADGIPVEVELHGASSALDPQLRVCAALHDPELRLGGVEAQMTRPGAHGPGLGPTNRFSHHTRLGRQWWTDVEHHGDVGPERVLDIDGAFRRQPPRGSVIGRSEGHTVVVDVGIEGEHLIAARVGQDVTLPVHEPVQASELADDVLSGLQHQVIGVRQHHRDIETFQVLARQCPDGPAGADRHETRGVEGAPRRTHRPGPRMTGGCVNGQWGSGHGLLPDRSSNMASPKDKNR